MLKINRVRAACVAFLTFFILIRLLVSVEGSKLAISFFRRITSTTFTKTPIRSHRYSRLFSDCPGMTFSQRIVQLLDLSGVVISSVSSEIVLKFKDDYDYHFRMDKRQELVDILVPLFFRKARKQLSVETLVCFFFKKILLCC